MGIVAMELAKKLWSWMAEHWREAGWLLAVLFLWLWNGVSADFTKCKAALKVCNDKPPVEIQVQAKGQAATHQITKIVYQRDPAGNPAPCPDVTVDSSTLALVDAALKERPAPKVVVQEAPYWGLELSGGVPTSNPGDSALGGSVLAGPWRLGAEYALQSGPRAVFAHRWMFQSSK